MEKNSTKTALISEEQKARLAEQEAKAKEEWQRKRAGYLKCLDLDSAPAETQFIDVNYNNGEKGGGRILICLGQFAMHARIQGSARVTMHNERIAMDETKDFDYDNLLTVLRQDVGPLLITRHEIDWTVIPEAPPENERHKYNYTLHVSHQIGEIAIHGLTKPYAIAYKKMIYTWLTFNNISIIPNP